ncbi:MAG: WD40/YVTN/BNR-like repeat-containing protein [Pyrinomonadaceae bacterium]
MAESSGGEQIIKICIPNAPDYYTQQIPRIRKIEFLTSGNIWLATGGLSKEIYYFENEGQVWKKLQIGAIKNFQTFDFPDAQNGWAVETNGNIWKTIDGGKNWNQVSSFANLIKENKFLEAEDIKFTSAKNGWLREALNFYQTTDGGQNWRVVSQLLVPPQASFFLGKNGWMTFGDEYGVNPLQIFSTTDNGENWTKNKIAAPVLTEAIFFINAKNGWLATSGDELYATDDAGVSWTKVNLSEKNFRTKSIFRLDAQNGWLAGAIGNPDKPVADSSASVPVLLNTTDGGRTWKKFELKNGERFFNQVYFADSKNGWIVSRDRIYKTSDGGQNWQPIMKIELSCQ